MTFGMFDDGTPSHPKLLRAKAEAGWLWFCSILYSNKHHLDGRIAKDVLDAVYPPLGKKACKLAERLCEVRLWHDRGDHFEIHDYEKYQSAALKDDVEIRQDYERERKRELRRSRAPSGDGGGKVYFARCEELIKIGFSKNPWARLEALRTASPSPVCLIGYINGTADDEKALHTRFAAIRSNLEWFHATAELLEYIEATATKPATGSYGSAGDGSGGLVATGARTTDRAPVDGRVRGPVQSLPVPTNPDLDPPESPVDHPAGKPPSATHMALFDEVLRAVCDRLKHAKPAASSEQQRRMVAHAMDIARTHGVAFEVASERLAEDAIRKGGKVVLTMLELDPFANITPPSSSTNGTPLSKLRPGFVPPEDA